MAAGPRRPPAGFGRSVTIDVRANDSFPDGEPLLVERIEATGTDEPIDRANLTTALGGAVRRDKGKLTYKAPAGTATFTDELKYVVIDKDGDRSAPAVVRVTVGENSAVQPCSNMDPHILVTQVTRGGHCKTPSSRSSAATRGTTRWNSALPERGADHRG